MKRKDEPLRALKRRVRILEKELAYRMDLDRSPDMQARLDVRDKVINRLTVQRDKHQRHIQALLASPYYMPQNFEIRALIGESV